MEKETSNWTTKIEYKKPDENKNKEIVKLIKEMTDKELEETRTIFEVGLMSLEAECRRRGLD